MTPFGKIALTLLPSFRFLQDNRDFFLTHDLSGLPSTFIHRLGELSENRAIGKLDEALAHAEQVIRGAEKYVWLMADQSMRQSYSHEHPIGVAFRLLFPKDIDPETLQRVRSRIGTSLQVGRVDAVKVSIAMNEKTAAVYFPSLDGRMDFARGFAGEKSRFHDWCGDLYSFFWSRAREG